MSKTDIFDTKFRLQGRRNHCIVYELRFILLPILICCFAQITLSTLKKMINLIIFIVFPSNGWAQFKVFQTTKTKFTSNHSTRYIQNLRCLTNLLKPLHDMKNKLYVYTIFLWSSYRENKRKFIEKGNLIFDAESVFFE